MGLAMIEQHIEGLEDVHGSLPERAGVGDLVERVVAGETAALGQLYTHHHAPLRAFARRLLGNEAAAEDLVHDVFIALPAALRRFEGRCTLRTFILSIAANRARQRARSLARRARKLDRFRSFGSQPPPAGPDEMGERKQLASLLERAIHRLPMEQRMVIVLCAVEERTSVEAADILGVPEGTVRTRLFHARKKLREFLQTNGLQASEPSDPRSEQ